MASFDQFLANIKQDKNSSLTQREPLKALFSYVDDKLLYIKGVLSQEDKESFLDAELEEAEEASSWINSLENIRACLKNYLFFSSEDSNGKSSAFLSELIREKKESYSLSGLEEEFDTLSIYEEDEDSPALGFEEPDFIDTDEKMEIEFEPEESELFMETLASKTLSFREENSPSKFEIKHQKNQWMKEPYRISKSQQQRLEREKSFSGFDKEVDKKNLKIEKQKKQVKEPLITEEQAKILLSDDCIKRWKFLSALSEYGMEKTRSGHGSHQVWGPKNGKLTFPIPLGKDGMLSVGVRRNIVKALLGE